MAQNEQDPSASTQQFRAFVRNGENADSPIKAPRIALLAIVGVVVLAAALITITLVIR